MTLRQSAAIAAWTALSLLGCSSKGADGQPSADKKQGDEKPSVSAKPSSTASASAPAPVAPGIAAVRAGKLIHPQTREELPLAETSLAKCFGFKGYSMMLPEGVSIEGMMGARACAIFLPKPKKKFGFMVMTDEIKVKMWKRTDVEHVKQKPLDEPDAFMFEVEEKGKPKLTGWLEKTIGPHLVQCNSMRDEGTMKLDDELAFIELCRTLKYAEPAKK